MIYYSEPLFSSKSIREVIIEKQLMEESLPDKVLSVENLAKPAYPAA
ncbi:hypothetical protein [Erwinia psidii]|nr:hypothetical protein [Erwinia psidii]